jgi:hypothetical protein
MAAPDSATASAVPPLTTLAALRQRHAELLKKVPAEGPDPEHLAEVQEFLRNGAAVGEWLDLPAEREEAQGILDYWRATLYAQNRARQASSPTESSGDKVRLKSAVLAPFNEQALKHIVDAVESSLETALREHPELQEVGRRVLLRLVRMDETTTKFIPVSARRSELVALAPPGKVAKILTLLERAGLLTIHVEPPSGDEQIQLAHEALTRVWTRLVGALEKRTLFRDAALFWDKHGRDRNALFTGDLLKEAEAYQDLNPLERAFVDACQAEAIRRADLEQSRRRRRFWTRTAVAVAILVPVAAGFFYGFSYFQAKGQVQAVQEEKRNQAKVSAKFFAMFGFAQFQLLTAQYQSDLFRSDAIITSLKIGELLADFGPPDIDELVSLAKVPAGEEASTARLKGQLALGAVQALELYAVVADQATYDRIVDALRAIAKDESVRKEVRNAAKSGYYQVLLYSASAKIVVQLSPVLQIGLQGRGTDGKLTQITYSARGSTNQTTLLVDCEKVIFGTRTQREAEVEQTTGLPNAPGGNKRLGLQSTWSHERKVLGWSFEIVRVTQILQLVKSNVEWEKGDKGMADTCLVGYVVKNSGNTDRNVCLTTELDTCIAGDDQNPFMFPKGKGGGEDLVTQPTLLVGDGIPPYIKAFKASKAKPEFVVWFTPLPKPNSQLGTVIRPARVAIQNLGEHFPAGSVHGAVEADLQDSALAFNWGPEHLPTGGECRFAYAVGLNPLSQETLKAQHPLIAEGTQN